MILEPNISIDKMIAFFEGELSSDEFAFIAKRMKEDEIFRTAMTSLQEEIYNHGKSQNLCQIFKEFEQELVQNIIIPTEASTITPERQGINHVELEVITSGVTSNLQNTARVFFQKKIWSLRPIVLLDLLVFGFLGLISAKVLIPEFHFEIPFICLGLILLGCIASYIIDVIPLQNINLKLINEIRREILFAFSLFVCFATVLSIFDHEDRGEVSLISPKNESYLPVNSGRDSHDVNIHLPAVIEGWGEEFTPDSSRRFSVGSLPSDTFTSLYNEASIQKEVLSEIEPRYFYAQLAAAPTEKGALRAKTRYESKYAVPVYVGYDKSEVEYPYKIMIGPFSSKSEAYNETIGIKAWIRDLRHSPNLTFSIYP